MALKYSPGLLSQLANFGQDLTSEQARSGRGISRGPGGMAGAIRDATRAVGSGLFGLDMRTPNEKALQEIGEIKSDDPNRLTKIVEAQLRAAMMGGDTSEAARLANVLENIQAQKFEREKLATPKVASSQTRFFKDSQNNRYARIMEVDQFGKTTFRMTPLEGAPESPVGKLYPTEGGLTSEERIAEAADQAAAIKQAENWADRSSDIINAGFVAIEEIPKLKKVLAIVEDPKFTSGGLQNVLEEFQNFFGLGSADVGEFKEYTSQILTQKLQNFEGAISNAEREYLETNLANFKQSPEINKRLLRNILEGFEQAKAKALMFAAGDPDTGKGWKLSAWLKFVEENRFVGNKQSTDDKIEQISANAFLGQDK